MLVQAIFEFDFDDSELSTEFIDIEGLAIDSLKREIKYLLGTKELSEEEFEYKVVNGKR